MNARQVICAAGMVVMLCACSASPDPGAEDRTAVANAIAALEQAIPAEMTVADAAAGPVITSLADTSEVVTRFGTVGVFRNEDEGISYLTYNGDASTLGVDLEHVGLIALVRWPDRDAVMFETDCSGSSCGWPNYALLELQADAAPHMLATDDLAFMAADMHSGRDEVMSPVLSVQADGSVLIGTAGDTRNWFVYRPGILQARP